MMKNSCLPNKKNSHEISSGGIDSQVGVWKGVLYAAPALTTTFLMIPILTILQGIYSKYFALELTSIAMVILVARLFDAFTDPIIGYFSDRYRVRFGTRKPFIVIGGLLLVVCSYFLYVPPDKVSVQYFLCAFLAFYLAWTIFEIPHMAWGGELTANVREKNRIYSLRAFFGDFGILLFYTVPMLPFFETQEFTPETLKWSVWIMGTIMLPLLYLAAKSVPNGRRQGEAVSSPEQKQSLRTTLISIVCNRPLLFLLGACFLTGIGAGMWMGLLYIFIDSYLGLSERMPLIFIIGTVAGLFALGIWYKVATRFGKKMAWAVGTVINMIAMVCTSWVSPGDMAFVQITLLVGTVFFGAAALNTLVPSLLSDIADYGTWKFRVPRAATYFSMFTLITKANNGMGVALGLMIAGWYGFDPSATIHSSENLFGLQLAMAYLPPIILIPALISIALIGIDTRRHKIIVRRLEARSRRAAKAVNSVNTVATLPDESENALKPTVV